MVIGVRLTGAAVSEHGEKQFELPALKQMRTFYRPRLSPHCSPRRIGGSEREAIIRALVLDRAPRLRHYLGEVLGVLEPAIELRGRRI